MVSPLSFRMLNFDAKANSVSLPFTNVNQNSRGEWQQFAQVKRFSGYSADKESLRSITSVTKQKTSKKRQIDKVHYQAGSAHSNLVRGGDTYKRSLQGSPCTHSRGILNTNAVKLITSSKNTPFKEEISMKYSDVLDLSAYSEMVQSSKKFYSISGSTFPFNNMKNHIPDQEKSIVSCNALNLDKSLISSDRENDDGTQLVIPARFEDYDQNEDTEDGCEEAENSEKIVTKDAIILSAVCSSSLEEAFAIQSSARLITGPKQPYIILHANAAFLQLSGISSNRLIGFSLNDIMNVPTTPSKLSECPASKDSVLVSLKSITSTTFQKKSTTTTYRLKTSKVYSGTRMTHLSINMEDSSLEDRYDNFIAMTG